MKLRKITIRIGLTVLLTVLATVSLAATHTVTIRNFNFDPPAVTVTVGDTVVWISAASIQHTTTSGSNCTSNGNWNSGLLSTGQSFQFVFNQAGAFPYFCIPHCAIGMTGSVQVDEVTGAEDVPDFGAALRQNYPNPFHPSTTIEYTTGRAADVEIVIFDAAGRAVQRLTRRKLPAGTYSATWDGRGSDGSILASGVYFYRMTVDDGTVGVRKMVLIK